MLEAASKEGALTGDVDAAARKTLREYRGATDGHGGGWDKWFTHRVGHGQFMQNLGLSTSLTKLTEYISGTIRNRSRRP